MNSDSVLKRVEAWWSSRTALEKVGVVALGAAAGVVTLIVVAPGFAATTAGGALIASGAHLVKGGMRA